MGTGHMEGSKGSFRVSVQAELSWRDESAARVSAITGMRSSCGRSRLTVTRSWNSEDVEELRKGGVEATPEKK